MCNSLSIHKPKDRHDDCYLGLYEGRYLLKRFSIPSKSRVRDASCKKCISGHDEETHFHRGQVPSHRQKSRVKNEVDPYVFDFLGRNEKGNKRVQKMKFHKTKIKSDISSSLLLTILNLIFVEVQKAMKFLSRQQADSSTVQRLNSDMKDNRPEYERNFSTFATFHTASATSFEHYRYSITSVSDVSIFSTGDGIYSNAFVKIIMLINNVSFLFF